MELTGALTDVDSLQDLASNRSRDKTIVSAMETMVRTDGSFVARLSAFRIWPERIRLFTSGSDASAVRTTRAGTDRGTAKHDSAGAKYAAISADDS